MPSSSPQCANRSCNATYLDLTPDNSGGSHTGLRVIFGIIAGLAFTSNGGLLCIIMRKRSMLHSSYNVLILSLAVTDMVTGVFIAATPSYIISLSYYPTPQGTMGNLFCRLIGSQFFVYVFAKVSVYTVTCLAIDRWYSVIKPMRYKINFTNKRVYGYITLIWLISFGFNAHIPFEMKLDEANEQCTWLVTSYRKDIVVTTYTLVTFVFPTAVTWTAFLCISIGLRDSFNIPKTKLGRAKARLLRTCVLVALLMTVCWFPNQLYYTLTTYGVTRLETPFHHFTIVLAMCNSTVNPWIYCASNMAYRKGFYQMFVQSFRSISHRRTFTISRPNLDLDSNSGYKADPRLRYIRKFGSFDNMTSLTDNWFSKFDQPIGQDFGA